MSLRLMSAVLSSKKTYNTQDNGDKLLKQLLECVQKCQKRYGGKTELATEFDSCVIGLCITLEAVLLHGFRVQTSALKQVSDIVANSLHLGGENLSFWPFVKQHLTKHEQERYNLLKHIWTDIGRGRAWIRSTLNERSLERYLHTLLGNQDLLTAHYEDFAILRDQEKSSMLPTMAAGIAAILFAVCIDKPELNSGIPVRIDKFKPQPEPIIKAPIPRGPRKLKKKTRVARQFISFDDDDCSMLSTSVPSTSSSSSETNEALSKTMHKIEENKATKLKISIETSGTRDKFIGSTPETLTPISHIEIGELAPVSVEVSDSLMDTTDEILEVPTDISAVLTALENRNKEELLKKQERIDVLSKENEILKEQLKSYVEAIQLLQSKDGGEDVEASLNSLQIAQPNFKDEAKLFERKLVQVAEMHAELMDFNVSLQQSLCQKDSLLQRLKSELEDLRGPLPDDESVVHCNVDVWIPSAFLTGNGSSSHHVYQIFLRIGNDEWNIYRRYAQFYALHADLKKLDPAINTFDFPPKKSIGKRESSIVEDRRKRLQSYLRRILTHWPELANCNSRVLLEQHLAFFKDQKEEIKNKGGVSPRNRNPNDNHYTGL